MVESTNQVRVMSSAADQTPVRSRRSGPASSCGAVSRWFPRLPSKAQVRGSRRDTRPAAGKSLWWLLAEGALVEHPGSFTWLPIPHTRIRAAKIRDARGRADTRSRQRHHRFGLTYQFNRPGDGWGGGHHTYTFTSCWAICRIKIEALACGCSCTNGRLLFTDWFISEGDTGNTAMIG